MKRMPNIVLTADEYEIICATAKWFSGGEANIYLSNKPNTLFKIFNDDEGNITTGMSDNKLNKIILQYATPLDYSVHPLSTISYNGQLIGYEMTYDDEECCLAAIRPPRQEMIHYLEQLKTALEYYAERDITYGDIADRNILINRKTGKVRFCDMDNIRMGEYPIDLESYDLACFKQGRGCIDDTTHAYLHNLLTIQQLLCKDSQFQDSIYKLSQKRHPKGFQKAAYPIFDSMVPEKDFTGEYVIPYVKKKVPFNFDKRKTWK